MEKTQSNTLARKRTTATLSAGGNAAYHNYLNDFADIEDPVKRRQLALQEIDNAKFGWYHIKSILVGGVGFMTDSYDIFAINLGITMMNEVFWDGNIPSSTQTLLKVSTSVGTVVGQVGFGVLADLLGRKKIYGCELIIIIVCTILQTMCGQAPGLSFTAMLTFYRIVMGLGIGGDYPLSSIITSEFATTKWRGAIMGAVFANQAWGQIFSGIVSIVCIAAYKDQLKPAYDSAHCGPDCKRACDQMWRILIGFGAIPGLAALYFRLTIPESPRYQLDVVDGSQVTHNSNPSSNESSNSSATLSYDNKDENIITNEQEIHVQKHSSRVEEIEANETSPLGKTLTTPEAAPDNKASFKDFWAHFGQWKYGKILLGTAGSWFMLDVAFYGLSLNTAIILQAIGYAGSKNVYYKLYNSAAGSLILMCAGSLPGYWVAVATIDTIGRKPIQVGGFIVLTGLFCGIGFGYHKLTDGGLLGLYIVTQFFQNFGPNVTTFIVPGECFPTKYRSTAHGISAASGKIGSIIAQTALGTLINHHCARDGKPKNCWLPHVMEIFALFMLLGIFTSLLIPETKRMTLEEISAKYHDEKIPGYEHLCSDAPKDDYPEENDFGTEYNQDNEYANDIEIQDYNGTNDYEYENNNLHNQEEEDEYNNRSIIETENFNKN
ncbi:hypothetical protein TBLA_0B02940 [Henningerozyma blattae CBS 6284]|uniref:Major facilitator superfamily (MFS) profile domain-containing protein n=1 Tax=Henningerozyma blattae (strain ATCC 34711 / CBS 6284 / DSM 70876 / NBRC 10599 / NRRL Y-10934 / UCD 77-7) TaxID=1071380 RepID=I2GYD4_HENB6|nr:hypothetical protein TBLA_0B02940 [Tetrapisispora blattae CBS 6284]CCH59136.1 hypothetical protein TBLA_0B02940 [Tetrapisispora blattae CBS 6284]